MSVRRAEVPGTAVFIFQPAEELLGGAKPMIEAGVLDNPRVDEIYGLHLTTQDAAGSVNVRRGPTMASGDGFSVEVTGKGGHGAYPHLSVDPMTAAAHILIGMQSWGCRSACGSRSVSCEAASAPDRGHPSSSVIGQWSEPWTWGRIPAALTRLFSSFETKT
jgi:metal-dependent amidase/aminoacylase/carboxypeptidase family protein